MCYCQDKFRVNLTSNDLGGQKLNFEQGFPWFAFFNNSEFILFIMNVLNGRYANSIILTKFLNFIYIFVTLYNLFWYLLSHF